jgi:uncharacterized protein (TIGR02453 family)
MRSGFPGYSAEAMAFFRSLARHNKREWFQPRKPVFDEHIKQPTRALVEALNGAMKSFAPEYVTDPDKAIYRIYRDTRFSNDKTPYKTHIAAHFHRRGAAANHSGGYYFQVSHKDVGMGGGVYMPERQVLLDIRQHIAEHHKELRKILASKPVRELFGEMHGEQLSRVPKGFLPTDPAADLLRFKSFFLYAELPADLATKPEFFPTLVKRFKAMKPFLDFVTAPMRKAPARLPDAW